MANKIKLLKAQLVIAQAGKQKNASKKGNTSQNEKKNEHISAACGQGKKDVKKDAKDVKKNAKATRNRPAVELVLQLTYICITHGRSDGPRKNSIT